MKTPQPEATTRVLHLRITESLRVAARVTALQRGQTLKAFVTAAVEAACRQEPPRDAA